MCTALHLLFVQTDTRATKQKGAVRLFICGGYARRKTRRRSELTECVENAPAKRCGCEPLQPSFNLLCCSHGRTWKLSITFFSPCSWRGVARRSDTMSAGARTHSHTQKQSFFFFSSIKENGQAGRHHVLFLSKSTLMIYPQSAGAGASMSQEFMNPLIDYVLFT